MLGERGAPTCGTWRMISGARAVVAIPTGMMPSSARTLAVFTDRATTRVGTLSSTSLVPSASTKTNGSGAGVGAGAGAGVGAGVGVGVGVGAGVGFGVGDGAGVGAGADTGVGLGAAATLGIAAGVSVGVAVGAGATTGAGVGTAAGAGVGSGTGAGVGVGVGAGFAVTVGAGVTTGAVRDAVSVHATKRDSRATATSRESNLVIFKQIPPRIYIACDNTLGCATFSASSM